MLSFYTMKLEITVGIGQRLMKASLIDPVGGMMPIQENVLLFCRMGNPLYPN